MIYGEDYVIFTCVMSRGFRWYMYFMIRNMTLESLISDEVATGFVTDMVFHDS